MVLVLSHKLVSALLSVGNMLKIVAHDDKSDGGRRSVHLSASAQVSNKNINFILTGFECKVGVEYQTT